MGSFHLLLCWRWSEERVRWQIWTRHVHSMRAVAFSPDGKSVAFGSDNLLTIWNVETGAEVSSFMRVRGGWWCFFYFDIAQALYRKWSGERMGWQVRTLSHSGRVMSVAFSADGKRVDSGAHMGAKVWDAETGAEVSSFVGVR